MFDMKEKSMFLRSMRIHIHSIWTGAACHNLPQTLLGLTEKHNSY